MARSSKPINYCYYSALLTVAVLACSLSLVTPTSQHRHLGKGAGQSFIIAVPGSNPAVLVLALRSGRVHSVILCNIGQCPPEANNKKVV